jgi:hypothetical protein
MSDKPFEFCPTPGEWEVSGITVKELRKLFDKVGDDTVFHVIAVMKEGSKTAGTLVAIYAHQPPFTNEDRSNLVVLKNAKAIAEDLLKFSDALGWDKTPPASGDKEVSE